MQARRLNEMPMPLEKISDYRPMSNLKAGTTVWNNWRKQNKEIYQDLHGVDLQGECLDGANLSYVDFHMANLKGARLHKANLNGALLRGTDLTGTDLREADLGGANLYGANLSSADLSSADLTCALFVGTNLKHANLSNCRIYGMAAWNLEFDDTLQEDLIITPPFQPTITVDNIEIAQFIYLLLNNEKIRHVIDSITSKVVLILGRFTPERKIVLDTIREELRHHNYLPILFDFDKPINRDLTETISTLAHMAFFIIADLTNARSIPQELEAIVPHLPSVPVQPLLEIASTEYVMFEHFQRYPWVLAPYRYENIAHLLSTISEHIIQPAEKKAKELRP